MSALFGSFFAQAASTTATALSMVARPTPNPAKMACFQMLGF
jgi:hypothetical protein